MNVSLYFIIFSAAWIALLFFPRFTKIQLWKTFFAACCSFCPLLLTGTFLWQEMGYRVSWVIFDILVVAYFTLTPLSCLTAFVWNTVDIVRYSPKTTESKELLRACGQLAVWLVFVVYLLFAAVRSSSARAADRTVFRPGTGALSGLRPGSPPVAARPRLPDRVHTLYRPQAAFFGSLRLRPACGSIQTSRP